MQKSDAIFLLNERIKQKEIECAAERILLKDQFKNTVEGLKPINLIKDMLNSSEVKNNLLNTTIGLTSGFIVKKAIVRSSENSMLKILGTIIGGGVANLVAKHPDEIKSIGGSILNNIITKVKTYAVKK